ncbi:MAG TPA: tRNA pseudouridine(55) synthase TruB [Bacillota bacterium]|nr:tRNA pseudouridine(55) synthase TruB [Bacillota bacterium]
MSELKGILPLLKPAGFTSHDCVNKIRRILRTKRVGHTGTLDPSVTGVLPICIGQATRVVEYIQDLPKEYHATIQIGRSTTTEDADGELIEEQAVSPTFTEEQVRAMVMKFVGEIEQVPPMYSAIKINGVRLYELAREGKEVERKARKVTIYSIEIEAMSLEQPFPEVTFRVRCSKGTYVRTLCVDIGKELGYPAHMKYLQRIASGPFQLKDCLTFEELEKAVTEGKVQGFLRPIDEGLLHYPDYTVNHEEALDVFNGKRLKIEKDLEEGILLRIYGTDQNFIALYRTYLYNGVVWGKPEKVFH